MWSPLPCVGRPPGNTRCSRDVGRDVDRKTWPADVSQSPASALSNLCNELISGAALLAGMRVLHGPQSLGLLSLGWSSYCPAECQPASNRDQYSAPKSTILCCSKLIVSDQPIVLMADQDPRCDSYISPHRAPASTTT